MKKRIAAIAIAVILLLATGVFSSAAGQTIGFETSFNAETGMVELTLFIDNAVGVQAADLCVGFDENTYTFDKIEIYNNSDNDSDLSAPIIVGGQSELTDKGLVTCTFMIAEDNGISEGHVDENGRMTLATAYFKPAGENYDTEDFFLWANSFSVNDVDICESINTQGNAALMEDRSQVVTNPAAGQEQAGGNVVGTTKKATEGVKGNLGSKWYVYVIGAVLVIGAVAGIAMVVLKSNNNENEEEAKTDEKPESESEKD